MLGLGWVKKKIGNIGKNIIMGIIKRKVEKMEFLKGKKTYLVALGIAIATGALQMGWIDQKTYEWIIGILGAGGLAAIRAGIKNG